MDEKELLEKIKKLEKKLNNFYKKEEIIKKALNISKEIYQTARNNSEIIISRAVNMAHDFKTQISNLLKNLNQFPNDYKNIINNFIKENIHFLNIEEGSISAIVDEILENLKN